jgi:AcrR family transcriptional regulator
MPRTSSGVYAGITADDRRAERRRKLMDAALDIIGTQGWTALTVRGVSEEGRVGPRFFYESFPDLDALANAIFDEIVDDALLKTLDAIAGAADDLRAKTHAAIETIITEMTQDPRRARLVFAEAHASEPLMRRRFGAMRVLAEALVSQTHQYLDTSVIDDVTLGAISFVAVGGVAELLLVWLDGRVDLTRDQVIDLVVQMMLTLADDLGGLGASTKRH